MSILLAKNRIGTRLDEISILRVQEKVEISMRKETPDVFPPK
jgi:hypothetical protein